MINLLDNLTNGNQNMNCSWVHMDVNRSRFSLDSRAEKSAPVHPGRIWTTAAFLFPVPHEPQLPRQIGLHGLDATNTRIGIHNFEPCGVIQRPHTYRLVRATMAGWKRMDGSGRTGAKAWVVLMVRAYSSTVTHGEVTTE